MGERIGGGIELGEDDCVRDPAPALAAAACQNDVVPIVVQIWLVLFLVVFGFGVESEVAVENPSDGVERDAVLLEVRRLWTTGIRHCWSLSLSLNLSSNRENGVEARPSR